jgi:signal transduction histidine kinase
LRTQLKEMLASSHAFQPVEVDHVSTGKGQRTLILDARPLSLPGHSERRVLVTFRDITVRKQAEAAKDLRSEQELRRSEAFLAEGQRLSLTGSFSWRVATDEITWSEQLYRIFAFDQDMPVTLELIGSRVHPEDIPLFNDMIDRARGACGDFDYEYRLQMPDHSVKYLHVIARGTRNKDGRLEYIGAVQDVTLRRLSEEGLAKARSELAHVSRVTSLGAMTASIAHEVNQPIAAAVTNAQAALCWLSAQPPDIEEVRQALGRIVKDGNRATDVIGRIRALVKKAPPRKDALEINEAVREVIALTRGEVVKNNVSVQTQLADGLPLIQGDRVQLQQVVLNLIINAVEAMSRAGEGPRELLIATGKHAPGGVFVAVQDTGPGLGPESFEHLFDAFYTTKPGGMGMGLPICRSIVEAHGGRIWASHTASLGTTLQFTLPVE